VTILPHLGRYFLCLGGNPLVGMLSRSTSRLQLGHFLIPFLLCNNLLSNVESPQRREDVFSVLFLFVVGSHEQSIGEHCRDIIMNAVSWDLKEVASFVL